MTPIAQDGANTLDLCGEECAMNGRPKVRSRARCNCPLAFAFLERAPAHDGKVERLVQQLNGPCKTATFEFAFSVGRLVIDGFYAGKLSAWRSRRGKDASFRKLASHPNLPMSAAALYRSTAIYELCQRVGVDH